MVQLPKLTARLLFLAALSSHLPCATAQGTISVNAGRGPVTVHVPSTYDPEVPMPVVMLLHGYGASGAAQENYLQFLPLSEQYGFLYLYPNGMPNSSGKRFWNGTDACCDFANSGLDDSSYLQGLIDEIKAALTVDANRVFLIGHSNGGFMSYRLACEHADTFAAIVSLAGATFLNQADCTPSEPVNVLQVHGSDDSTILYGGGNLLGNFYPSATGSAERWATYAGCNLTPDTSAPNLNLESTISGAETSVTRWTNACNPGGAAELWTIQGGGHVPNFNGNFRIAAIEWLLAHPKPGLGSRYCAANANSTGAPARMLGSGSLSLGSNNLMLQASSVPAGVNGIFFYGPLVHSAPLGGGVLCISAGSLGMFRLPVVNSGILGTMQFQPNLLMPPQAAGQIQAGQTWKFQAWFRDSAAGVGQFNLSDALALTFLP